MQRLVVLLIPILIFSASVVAQIQSEKFVEAALQLTKQKVVYNAAYFSIPYPNGDVPKSIGVCADVVIRAYRLLAIDLQKEVHEDMKKCFNQYPNLWNLKSTDSNIDHRRVPNLMVFFKRKGNTKPITKLERDYIPGDIVCWHLPNNQSHIGIVVNKKSNDGKRWMIVHNIGNGQELSDCLFNYPIIAHYTYKLTN